MKRLIKKFRRSENNETPVDASRITNETLEETRKEVLKSSRKFVYPIQKSKHRVVILSSLIGAAVLVAFVGFSLLSLYRYKSTSTFIYRVTQVVPFPVAKAGKSFVSYEDYLFEIRQYIHYFETQEKVNFSEVDGRQQLAAQRKIALQKVIDQAYIRQIAKEKRITVSDEEVDAEIELLQSQNRLGSNPEALQEIIRDYYGWTVKDFRRSLSDRVLFTKVLAALDTETTERANAALAELNAGADFSALAAKYSDDPSTKDKGGEISFLIEKVDRNVPAQMTSALYALNPGEVSGLVNVGYGLEIVKNLEEKDGKIRAAYILFNFKDMQVFLNTEKEKHKATSYIHL
jgi:hypothetical protein